MTITLDAARLSRRRFLAGAGSLAATLAVTGCGSGSTASKPAKAAAARVDGDLHMFSWDGYVPPAIVRGFEKEYGVSVKTTAFASSDEALQRLASGLPFDLAFVGSPALSRAVEGNLLRPVDRDGIKNYDTLLPAFQNVGYEPNDPAKDKRNAPYVGITYTVGGTGLVWDVDRIGKQTLSGSWDDLWTYADGVASGHAFMFDEAIAAIAIALARDGKTAATASTADLKAAGDSLIELKRHLAGFSSQTSQPISSGKSWIQPGFTGDVFATLTQLDDPSRFSFQTCRETSLYTSDTCVIPKAAKSPGTATVFMDYLLRPKNVEAIVRAIGYIVPTAGGAAAFQKLTSAFPFLRADVSQMQDFATWLPPLDIDQLKLWQQTWTRVKAS